MKELLSDLRKFIEITVKHGQKINLLPQSMKAN